MPWLWGTFTVNSPVGGSLDKAVHSTYGVWRLERILLSNSGRGEPTLNKPLVLDLARCECMDRSENIIALGNSGTGKTHIALGLGLAACRRG